MSDYTRVENFTAKDALPTGNAEKIILGSDMDAELNAARTAINSKFDIDSLDRGELFIGDSSGDAVATATGSAGQVLTSDGTDTSWGYQGWELIETTALTTTSDAFDHDLEDGYIYKVQIIGAGCGTTENYPGSVRVRKDSGETYETSYNGGGGVYAIPSGPTAYGFFSSAQGAGLMYNHVGYTGNQATTNRYDGEHIILDAGSSNKTRIHSHGYLWDTTTATHNPGMTSVSTSTAEVHDRIAVVTTTANAHTVGNAYLYRMRLPS